MGTVEEWQNSYHGKIRTAMGDAVLLHVGARGVIRDEQGRFLLIKRADNGRWAFPVGGMEVGESLAQCAIRETHEETGLLASKATLIALMTTPDHTHTDIFGFTYQHLSASYLLEGVTGVLNPDPGEASEAGWFLPSELPSPASSVIELTLDHLAVFEATGCPVVE